MRPILGTSKKGFLGGPWKHFLLGIQEGLEKVMPDLSLQGKEKPARLSKGKRFYRGITAGTSVSKSLKAVESQDMPT